ncbi:MAG: bifunctional 4-hydroxy-2-oxoglutarate aldolase/2-dehydro-3-deoxy-phosphogluconate aldolase [Jiangellaceae bacterium]
MTLLGDALRSEHVVAIVRQDDATPDDLVALARALAGAGLRLVEFPLTNPRAVRAIELIAGDGLELTIGAGTVRTPAQVRDVAAAGGSFVVSPHVNADVIAAAREHGLGTLPGAFTPTEIELARSLGADAVKVFPAGPVGPGYISALLGPFPDAVLVPTGGISLELVPDFLGAGAAAVGVGMDLLGDGSADGIGERVRRLRARLAQKVPGPR